MKLSILSAVITLSAVSLPAFATTDILDSLKSQGVAVEAMSDEALSEARGAAYTLLTSQPAPSATHGLTVHMVKWKKFGSTSDYLNYNYVGNYQVSDNHSNPFIAVYNGSAYHVAGDQWAADDITAGSAWTAANAYVKEEHYQILNYPADTATIYGLRSSSWNRPISTFSW